MIPHEVETLERYLDEYLESSGLTFDQWLDTFGSGLYHTRNEVILKLLAPLAPKRIFEFACAGGFLAKLLLETIPTIERYTCSNFSTRVAAYCERQLAPFVNCAVTLVDANVRRSTDMDNVGLHEYDTFLTTSLEHIEFDHELILRFPPRSTFVFCVAGFDDPEHFRLFAGPQQIRDRYQDLLAIERIETIGEEHKKFVVLARTRTRSGRMVRRALSILRGRTQ